MRSLKIFGMAIGSGLLGLVVVQWTILGAIALGVVCLTMFFYGAVVNHGEHTK